METPINPRIDKLHGQKTLRVTGFLEEFEKDDIKKNIDIVELFASFNVKLSKVGKNYMGLCPFHKDSKTPSLSVSREKGLYNCFGCGEDGDAFTLVEKMKGFDFKEALKFLKEWSGLPAVSRQPLAVSKEDDEVMELKANSQPLTANLNTVKNYYHKRLFDHPEALEYLKKRGLTNTSIYERFQIGFADSGLNLIIGESQRKELTEAGIFNDKGSEHFLNCVVFPIFDDSGNTLSFYGRDISEDSSFKHRYLKGSHKGVFNCKVSRAYNEIILTESIIDALSLIEIGFENVQPIYGTNGFTDEHLETLKADCVKTVVLALDADEAGRLASEKLKEKLISEGFRVKIISPWQAKDWNQMLTTGKLIKDDLTVLIDQAAIFGTEENETEALFKVSKEEYFTAFIFGNSDGAPVVYKVAGLKETFVTSMKVNIKAEYDGNRYFDNLDLYLARSRASFAGSLSRAFGEARLEPKRIENDLNDIVDYFESERDRRSLLEKEKEKKPVLTEEERHAALEFLKSPDLFSQIVKDMEILGYVGEDLNKQLLYLCASSRILDDPISVLILSESASGKSMLVDTVRKLIPPEDVIAVTSLSDQALNYIKDLMHKFLILGEAVHSDEIEHSIREMLSGHELSRLVTVKDEKTGKMDTIHIQKPTIVASVMSSTRHDINSENASRCFVAGADESREQTRRIHEAQRRKYSLERYMEKSGQIPLVIKKHHAAQRMLRKLVIVNPEAGKLDFPDNFMRTRRDNDRFMDLIACVCFLRQYQKEVKTAEGLEYIECDDKDIEIACGIMKNAVVSSTLLEISKSAAELHHALLDMAGEISGKNGLKVHEIRFTQRDIREKTGFEHCWIKRNLRELVDLEYIELVRGGRERSKGFYRLKDGRPIEKPDISMVKREKGKQDKELEN